MKDYIDLPASVPFDITGNPNPPQTAFIGKYPYGTGSVVSTDIDGDGRDELVAFNPNANMFGIISYFNYADVSNSAGLSPGWSSVTNDQLITTYASQNFIPGTTLDSSDVVGLGDFDGDGQEEIFVFSQNNLTFSLLKWNTATNMLEQVFSCSSNLTGIELNATDTFMAADIDGDGADELIVFSGWNAWLFPVQWSSSTTNGVTTFTPSMGWYPPENIAAIYPQTTSSTTYPIDSSTRFYIGDFDGDGAEEFLVFTPDTMNVYILKWTLPSGAQQYQFYAVFDVNATIATVGLNAADWFYPVDLDGDGSDELVIFYPGPGGQNCQLWIVDFDASNPLALTASLVWNPTATTAAQYVGINPSDLFYFGDFDGDGAQEIVMYSQVDNWFFLLDWNSGSSTLSSAFASQTLIPTGYTQFLTSVVATNTFYPVDLNGDGTDELVLYNVMTQMMGTMPTYQNSANLSILRYANQAFTSTWKTTTDVPAWNLATILSAPSTPFSSVPFTGTQLPVYQYVSNLVLPHSDGDIRASYTNLNITSGEWCTWAQLLQTTPNPPAQNFSDSDWTAVTTTLVNEFSALGPVVAMTNNAASVLPVILNQQSTDLSTVIANIGPLEEDTALEFWLDLAFQSLAIGAVASVSSPAGQAALAISLNVAMSLVELAGQNQGAPTSVSYSSLLGTLASNYVQAVQANGTLQATILGDAVMLPVTGQLALGAWPWTSNQLLSAVTSPAASAADRVAFYQQLLSVVCQFSYTPNCETNYLNVVPAWAQYVLPQDNGQYTVYWISLNGEINTPPSQMCLSDLFYNCGVSQGDFYLGVGPWAAIWRQLNTAHSQAAVEALTTG